MACPAPSRRACAALTTPPPAPTRRRPPRDHLDRPTGTARHSDGGCRSPALRGSGRTMSPIPPPGESGSELYGGEVGLTPLHEEGRQRGIGKFVFPFQALPA